jgi:PAS domain S-box-containing protein
MPSDSSAGRGNSVLLWISPLAILLLVFATPYAEAEQNAKNVLVLFSQFHRGHNVWLDDIESRVRARVPSEVNFVAGYLEYSQLDDPAYLDSEAEILRRQYQNVKLDLIIPVAKQALRFVLEHRNKIFPNVPIVFTAVDAELELSDVQNLPGVTGYAPCEGIRPTIDLALRLHPDATTVAVISHDKGFWWAATHAELLHRRDKVTEIDIIGPPNGQMIEKVAALPPHSVVLYQVLMSEYSQPAIDVYDASEMVAQRVPTYSPWENLVLGHGGVGGAYKKYIKEALITGDIAARVLLGTRPEDIPIVRDYGFDVVVDWRALQRWHIPQSALPTGAMVFYREPTLWERNRNYIFAGLGLIVAQALLIFGLLWQRTRRRKTEAELRESEEKFSKSFRQSPLAVTITNIQDARFIEVNEAFERYTGWKRDEVLGRTPFDIQLWESPEQRLALREQLLATGNVRDLEFRVRRKDGQVLTGLGSAELIEVNGEPCVLSVAADISERKMAENALAGVSRKLIEAQEAERTRIARELHDDINQRLAMLAINLKTVREDLSFSETETSRRLEEACTQVSGLENDIQALSHRLHSSGLEYLGLEAAVSGFCREVSERQNLSIHVRFDGVPQTLPHEVSLCLFRVLQEAVHNAVKYSGVRDFEVSLTGGANEIELSVHDSGIGFDPATARHKHGLGLTSMRERLRLVNGQLSIESKQQNGTTILARVPLNASVPLEPVITTPRSVA